MRKILKKDSLETLVDNSGSDHQSQTKKLFSGRKFLGNISLKQQLLTSDPQYLFEDGIQAFWCIDI